MNALALTRLFLPRHHPTLRSNIHKAKVPSLSKMEQWLKPAFSLKCARASNIQNPKFLFSATAFPMETYSGDFFPWKSHALYFWLKQTETEIFWELLFVVLPFIATHLSSKAKV